MNPPARERRSRDTRPQPAWRKPATPSLPSLSSLPSREPSREVRKERKINPTTEHTEHAEHVLNRIARLLPSGESIRWIGQPVPRYFYFWCPFHLFLGLFLLTTAALLVKPFFTVLEGWAGRGWFLSILFVPWVVEGILLMLSPLRRHLADRATVYAVTDRHAVRLGRWRGQVWTTRAEPIRKNLRNGRSSVQFATWTSYFGGSSYGGLPIHHPIAFENLSKEEADKAEEALWQAYRLVTGLKLPDFEAEVMVRPEETLTIGGH